MAPSMRRAVNRFFPWCKRRFGQEGADGSQVGAVPDLENDPHYNPKACFEEVTPLPNASYPSEGGGFNQSGFGEPHVFQSLYTDLGDEGAEIAILCYLHEHRNDFLQWLAKRKIDPSTSVERWMRNRQFRVDAYATLLAAGLRLTPDYSGDSASASHSSRASQIAEENV